MTRSKLDFQKVHKDECAASFFSHKILERDNGLFTPRKANPGVVVIALGF
jgi:hypothetical protein